MRLDRPNGHSVAVYCIAEVKHEYPFEFDRFKIGISTNVRKRLSALQTGNPRRLAIIMVDWYRPADAAVVETRCHEYLAAAALTGEWFDAGRGCPFKAMVTCGWQRVSYPPTTDFYLDCREPDYEQELLPIGAPYTFPRRPARGALQ